MRAKQIKSVVLLISFLVSKISGQKPVKEKPLIERPTSEQKEQEKREFGELFVNLDDDDESDSELIDFVPKQKV